MGFPDIEASKLYHFSHRKMLKPYQLRPVFSVNTFVLNLDSSFLWVVGFNRVLAQGKGIGMFGRGDIQRKMRPPSCNLIEFGSSCGLDSKVKYYFNISF